MPLRGKPIIDIQVAVAEHEVASAVAALQEVGYEHHGPKGRHVAEIRGAAYEWVRRTPS